MLSVIRFYLATFSSKFLDFHMRELIEKAASAFMLKVLAALVMLIFNIVLARELGAKGAGSYFLGMTLVVILAVIGRVGLDNALLKYIASYASKNQFNVVKDIYRRGVFITLMISVTIALLLLISGRWISINLFNNKELADVIYIFALTIVPVALVAITAESLKGLKRIPQAISVQSLFVPAFALIGILISVDVYGLYGVAWSYLVANILTLILAAFFWHKYTPGKNVPADASIINLSKLMSTSVPMYWVALFQIINVWFSTLALGAIGSSEDVGIFNVAGRTAVLTSFVLIAVNSIAAPKFAALYEQSDNVGLEITAKHTAKLATIMASPFLFVFIVFPEWIMGVFGDEFISGAVVLTIIAIGQFVNVSTGSVGYLLMMTDNEKAMRNNLFFCTGINVLLNLSLIPLMGVIGAAISTALVLAVQNLISVWIAWKKLGVVTLPIGVHRVYVKK